MVKVNFILKTSKANKKGESPIFAKLIYAEQFTEMSTGKFIAKKRWKETEHLSGVLKIEKEKVIRATLQNIVLAVDKKYYELQRLDEDWCLSDLKELVQGKQKSKKITALKILEKHNINFKKKVDADERSVASLQKYERAKELLGQFIQKKYKTADFLQKNIGSAFICGLEEYLRYESTFNGITGIQKVLSHLFVKT